MALTIFTGLALGAATLTYLALRQNSPRQSPETNCLPQPEAEQYTRILAELENYCRRHNLDHRFVGGTLTDLIGLQTEFEIDAAGKTIKLINPNPQTMIRGDNTIKDIDLVIFSKDRQVYLEARRTFAYWARAARERHLPFPQISVEAAYHPDRNWPKRNKLKQFVTAFEVDDAGNITLAFGNIRQQIQRESVESWTVILENGTRLTVFSPIAHRLCYELRVPSGIKPKDIDKMPLLTEFARKTIAEGSKHGIDYTAMYQTWQTYIDRLKNHPDPLTRAKAAATGLYWRTLGTQVAHGTGPLGRLSKLSDRLSG